eukprot:1542254-Pleurochrysis_carterae.AAC.4
MLVEAIALCVHNGLVSFSDGQVVNVDANTHHEGVNVADKDARVRPALSKAACEMPVAQLEIPATATVLESVDSLVELADHLFPMGSVKAKVLFAAVRNGHVYQFLEGGLQAQVHKVCFRRHGVTRDKGPGAFADVVVDFSFTGLLSFGGINMTHGLFNVCWVNCRLKGLATNTG